MDKQTIHYYDRNAEDLRRSYDSADLTDLHELLGHRLRPGWDVMEIGCGTGRDGLFMASLGCRITAVDGSSSMVDLTRQAFLKAGETCCAMEAAFPLPPGHVLLDRSFDAVVSIAMLMHVPDGDMVLLAEQIGSLLKEKGLFICSFCSGERQGDDRLYVDRDPDQVRGLFETAGFRLLSQGQNRDGMGRDLLWHTIVFERISHRNA